MSIHRPVQDCLRLGAHSRSDRRSFNIARSKWRRQTFKYTENILLEVQSRIVPAYSRHKVFDQKLEGCDAQPFIVNVQTSAPNCCLRLQLCLSNNTECGLQFVSATLSIEMAQQQSAPQRR